LTRIETAGRAPRFQYPKLSGSDGWVQVNWNAGTDRCQQTANDGAGWINQTPWITQHYSIMAAGG